MDRWSGSDQVSHWLIRRLFFRGTDPSYPGAVLMNPHPAERNGGFFQARLLAFPVSRLLPTEVECNDSTVACFPSGLAPLVHGIFGYLQIIAMDSFQNSEVCPDGLKAGSLKQRHETARLCPERRLLRPSSVDPCDQLGTPHQLPRVMGISTSRCNSMCFENSSLASDARCTSSGPSARRSVRWCA